MSPKFTARTMISCDYDYTYNEEWASVISVGGESVRLPFDTCLNIIAKAIDKFNLK